MERGRRRLLSASEVPLTSNSNALRPSLSKHFRSERQHSPSPLLSAAILPTRNAQYIMLTEMSGLATQLSLCSVGALPSFPFHFAIPILFPSPVQLNVGSVAVTVGNYPPDETGGRGEAGLAATSADGTQ